MATQIDIEKALSTSVATLETSLALQWGIATGAIRAGADVDQQSRNRTVADFRRVIGARVAAAGPAIKRLICDNLEYCKNKNTKQVKAAILLADAKLVILTGVALPIASVTAYVIKVGFLDHVCCCAKEPKKAAGVRKLSRGKVSKKI